MKTRNICALAAAASGLLLCGCVYTEPVPPPPPGPAVVVDDYYYIPDDYCWDGYEYVGYVGDQCYYLGPGNVWIICDPVRFGRFQRWQYDHPDWRAHVTVNVRFRNDAHGHFHPRGQERREERHEEHHDRGHDRGEDHGRGNGHDHDQ